MKRTVLAIVLAGCGGGAAGSEVDAPASDSAPNDDALAPDAATADAAPATCAGRDPQPLDAVWTLTVGSLDRTFRVHVPASYDPTRPTPLVFDFHGYTMSGQSQEDMTRFAAKSDQAGFVVVHPDGTGALRGWNAGRCCGTAASTGVDDLGFVDAMIAELDARLCIDGKRIYATGFSNGGFLSHRLGCERAGVFAAIAPVSGVMGIDGCAPVRPMPVMHVHGTADTVVPYNGSVALGYEPAPTTVAGWVARDHCTAAPVVTFEQGDARCEATRGCDGGAEVVFCTITGGGHTWPGGAFFPGGHISTDLSATDAMWDFFVQHPLP